MRPPILGMSVKEKENVKFEAMIDAQLVLGDCKNKYLKGDPSNNKRTRAMR